MTQAALDQHNPSFTARPRAQRSRWGWPLGRELTLLTLGLIGYRLVRLLVKDEVDEAFVNSQRVVDWERTIGIFTEVDLQSSILGNDAVIWFLNRYYFFGHFCPPRQLASWCELGWIEQRSSPALLLIARLRIDAESEEVPR